MIALCKELNCQLQCKFVLELIMNHLWVPSLGNDSLARVRQQSVIGEASTGMIANRVVREWSL